jgi:hypothetical protein
MDGLNEDRVNKAKVDYTCITRYKRNCETE